eukprot:c19978_g1_i2 orf=219-755(-)
MYLCIKLTDLCVSPAGSICLDHRCPRLEALEEFESQRVVLALYKALGSGDVGNVQRLVASDLEWWFHGPRSKQNMMLLLTGETTCESYRLKPVYARAMGNKVFVEGQADTGKETVDDAHYWVHVWTVKGGKLTHLREYINTAVTVMKRTRNNCSTVWQSTLWMAIHQKNSLPSLVLAI